MRLAIPTRHNRPEPKSHAAAGMGTVVVVHKPGIEEFEPKARYIEAHDESGLTLAHRYNSDLSWGD